MNNTTYVCIGLLWLVIVWAIVFVRLRKAFLGLGQEARDVLVNSFPETNLFWGFVYQAILVAVSLVSLSQPPPNKGPIFVFALLLVAWHFHLNREMRAMSRLPTEFLSQFKRERLLSYIGLLGFLIGFLLS